MGAARQAPNPKFEENFKKDMEGIKDLPEDKRGMAFATSLLTRAADPSGSIIGRSGRATMSDTGIIKPSASATIKSPEPTPDPSMQFFVGGDQADKEQTFEDVRTNLLAKAKERRSKISEMKQEVASKLAMPSPTSELDKFSIENYRAGGAKFDRDDTKSVGDDMATGKPSTSERAKSFLGNMMGGFGVRLESQ